MSLPAWWPRTSCVYCGERIPRTWDTARGLLRGAHRLACPRHVALIAHDPLWKGAL